MNRQFRFPKPYPSKRETVKDTAQDSILTALKTLRTISRDAQATVPLLETDLLVLERVYYKWNNVQRPNIMWRKLKEMRRICNRLSEAGVVSFIDEFRRAFYDTSAEQKSNPKKMKSNWTQLPSMAFVHAGVKRVAALIQLAQKCLEVCEAAYSAIVLYFGVSGFFANNVVLLALSARLRHLARDQLNACTSAIAASTDILEAVERGSSRIYNSFLGSQRVAMEKAIDYVAFAEPEGQIPEDQMDLGQSIERNVLVTGCSSNVDVEAAFTPILVDDDDSQPKPTPLVSGPLGEDCHTSIIEMVQPPKRKDRPRDAEPKPKNKKKKQVQRDEIDDIFGF